MTKQPSTKDQDAHRAALAMLMEGLATPSEVAQLAGVSRQLVRFWARAIDWRKARSNRLAKEWRARLKSR